jgi:hypothetical protein
MVESGGTARSQADGRPFIEMGNYMPLHRTEPDDEGFYLAYNGHRRPHFVEPFNRRGAIKSAASSKKKNTTNVDARRNCYHLAEDLLVLNRSDAAFIAAKQRWG